MVSEVLARSGRCYLKSLFLEYVETMYQLLLSLILALKGLSNVGPKNPTPNSTCHAEGAERPKDLGRGYPFPDPSRSLS
jgi:hypothetical protein